MKRMCTRCGSVMKSGYELGIKGSGMTVKLKEEDMLMGKGISRLKAAVCPECGEVSIYLEDPEVIQTGD